MQIILSVVTLVAGILGLLFGIISRRAARNIDSASPLSPAFVMLWLALAAVVLFLPALLSTHPFSPGLQLGWGILFGALLGIIAVARSAKNREEDGMAHAIELLSLAAIGPALLLIFFRGYPNEAMIGLALGAVLAALGAGALLRPLLVVRESGESSIIHGAELFALATACIVAGTRLAIDHFPRNMPFDFAANRWAAFSPAEVAGGYWAFPALAVAAAALVMALIPRDVSEKARRWLPLGIGAAGALAVVVLAAILGAKLLPELTWRPLLYGLVAFGLIAAGLAHQGRESGETQARPLGLAFGAVIFTLAVLIIAFRGEMRGYGEALVLLVVLPIVATQYLAAKRDPLAASLIAGALAIGLLLVLFRVFLERSGSSWTLDFQQHYDLVAALLGASATFGLLAFAGRTMERLQASPDRGHPAMLAGRAALLVIFILVAPPALAALWGVKGVSAFLAGLIVGLAAWMMLAAWTVGRERAAALAAAPHLPFILAALVAAQLTGPIFALELTNAVKLVIAIAITVALLVWVTADGLLRGRAPADPEAETVER
jgi:hypothetical protein